MLSIKLMFIKIIEAVNPLPTPWLQGSEYGVFCEKFINLTNNWKLFIPNVSSVHREILIQDLIGARLKRYRCQQVRRRCIDT